MSLYLQQNDELVNIATGGKMISLVAQYTYMPA